MSYDKDRNKDYPTRTFKKRSYGNDDESYSPRYNDYSGDRGDTRGDRGDARGDRGSGDRGGDYRERSNDRGGDYRERSNDRGDYPRNDSRERNNTRGDYPRNDRNDYQRNDSRERNNNDRGDYQRNNNDRGDYQRNDYRERNNNNDRGDRGDYQQRNDYRRERPAQEDNEYRWNREGANLGNASGYPNNSQQRYYSRQPRPYQQPNNNPYQQRPSYQPRPYQPRPYQQGGGGGYQQGGGGGGHYQQGGGGGGHYQQGGGGGYQQRNYDNGGSKNNAFVRRQPPMQRDNQYDRPQQYVKRPSGPGGKMPILKKKAPARFMKKSPVSPKHFISLPRALRSHQFASRQIAIDFIKNARVLVNNAVMSDPNARVNAKRDRLMVDAMPLAANRLTYIVVNKPKGLVPSKEINVETMHSLVPHTEHWHFPAGRLNKAATGLVILTNDPAQNNYLNSPFKQLEKEYHVKVHRAPKKTEITAITKALRLLQSDEYQKEVRVEILQKNARSCWLAITLHEGKLTEMRSALKEVGLEVLSFHRYRIGGITTHIISAGSWKQMNELEIAQLTDGDTLVASFLFKKLERVNSRHKLEDNANDIDENADLDDDDDDKGEGEDEVEQTQE